MRPGAPQSPRRCGCTGTVQRLRSLTAKFPSGPLHKIEAFHAFRWYTPTHTHTRCFPHTSRYATGRCLAEDAANAWRCCCVEDVARMKMLLRSRCCYNEYVERCCYLRPAPLRLGTCATSRWSGVLSIRILTFSRRRTHRLLCMCIWLYMYTV